MRLKLKRVDMADLVKNQATLFQEVCSRKGLLLEHKISDPVPVVLLDHEKVERIVSNLIRNAVKFTDAGKITVKVSATEKPTLSRGNGCGCWRLRMRVKRSG